MHESTETTSQDLSPSEGHDSQLAQKERDYIKSLENRIRSLESRSPSLCLTPESGYRFFSDGKALSWLIEENPKMSLHVPKLSDKFFDKEEEEEEEEEEEQDGYDAVDLDEAHWNAVMFQDVVVLMIRPRKVVSQKYHDDPLEFWLGTPGRPLTLRSFVDEVRRKMTRPLPRTDSFVLELYKSVPGTGRLMYGAVIPGSFDNSMFPVQELRIESALPDDAVILSSADIDAMKAHSGPVSEWRFT